MTAPERRRASAPPIPRPGVASDAALDDLRRRLYIGISVLGIGIQAAMWILNLHRDAPDPVTTYTNPLFTVLSSWVIWWMARRRPVEIVNWVGLSACGLVIILRAVITPLMGGADLTTSLQDLYWLLVIVSIIAFLTVDYRRAMLVTAGFYVSGTLLPWGVLLLDGATLSAPARLAQGQLLCGIVLITLCSLAWYREHFQRGREELQLTQRLASTDALTGLHNRHALYPLIEAVLHADHGEASGTEGRSGNLRGSLLLIDIDHFKRINDRLGHNVGDDVLRLVAVTLKHHLRGDDIVGRWGGEEYLVALPGVTYQDALVVAERLRHGVQRSGYPAGVDVTISVGLTELRGGDTLRGSVARADTALYEAKRQGRNRVQHVQDTPPVPAQGWPTTASGD
ncbi:GGDEF domain-containing protein [Deinococcus sp. KSM4-11]|uniref:GGDEF domain-containing protein n=1 Tax=Deinococcus sp. KSM4-11 TaxID=2568654 RepID=UPI0010A2F7F4|nr:GGDEF domain-containing protein [Deinococcus sp. KSM4-11]THF83556.1 GGDEF domain-containing protein [Deinococcus sp. KSM4-11]